MLSVNIWYNIRKKTYVKNLEWKKSIYIKDKQKKRFSLSIIYFLFIYFISKMRAKKKQQHKQAIVFKNRVYILMALPRLRSKWNTYIYIEVEKEKENISLIRSFKKYSIIIKTKKKKKTMIFLSKMLIFCSKLTLCRNRKKKKIKSYCNIHTHTNILTYNTWEEKKKKQTKDLLSSSYDSFHIDTEIWL